MPAALVDPFQWGPWYLAKGRSYVARARNISPQDIPSVPQSPLNRLWQRRDGSWVHYEYANVEDALNATYMAQSTPQTVTSPEPDLVETRTSDPAPQEEDEEEEEEEEEEQQLEADDDAPSVKPPGTSGAKSHVRTAPFYVEVVKSRSGNTNLVFPDIPQDEVIVVNKTEDRKSKSDKRSKDGSRSDKRSKNGSSSGKGSKGSSRSDKRSKDSHRSDKRREEESWLHRTSNDDYRSEHRNRHGQRTNRVDTWLVGEREYRRYYDDGRHYARR
ncbi:hypothetical protein B0T10DRAFT_457276 [Thelonectria olida]|uniref:Uncharacterized protein n=1 Tax=Thelonectria olida TaxID=1576542 RepID=A0A9P8W9B7_9HYPO|nr:hypothetical protein B0T10DRAFT_457276 [Thelonectria olida]